MQIKKYLINNCFLLSFFFICFFLAACRPIYSQALPVPKTQFPPKHYVCYRTGKSLNIDGKLNETAWQKAPWTDFFTDIEGEIKPSPRFKTRAKMLWDDTFLYIAAELGEPDVWATLQQRDAVIFNDNDFEVFIDPDGDTHNYYEFEINAFNTVWDLLLIKPYRMGGPPVNAWDIQGLLTGVDVQGTINKPGDKDQGWTIEIAFPWKVLMQCAGHKGRPEDGEQWRLNFSRVEWESVSSKGVYKKKVDPSTKQSYQPDNWVWSPQGLIDMHYPEMWGYIQFSENIAGTKEENFIQRPEEYAKWALRQIFYKEKAYYSNNKVYTNDLKELDIHDDNVPFFQWPPVIETASDCFEISIMSSDKKKKIYLFSDGKIWEKQI